MSERNYTEIKDGVPMEYRWLDGKLHRLTGYVMKDGVKACPTDLCNAYCCRTGTIYPDLPPPCPFLTEGNQCSIHLRGGYGAKPHGCVEYPRNQEDIDAMNKNAVGDFRCHLKFEPV